LGDSWIGGKIIIKEDGTNLWLNKNHDTICIKTQAKLNEAWTAFNIVDSLSIKAKVVDHDTVQFLGLIDSVKTIDLLAYDKNLNPIKINGMDKLPLKISKNHGIIQTFDVYYFLVPERGYNYIDEYHERYQSV